MHEAVFPNENEDIPAGYVSLPSLSSLSLNHPLNKAKLPDSWHFWVGYSIYTLNKKRFGYIKKNTKTKHIANTGLQKWKDNFSARSKATSCGLCRTREGAVERQIGGRKFQRSRETNQKGCNATLGQLSRNTKRKLLDLCVLISFSKM